MKITLISQLHQLFLNRKIFQNWVNICQYELLNKLKEKWKLSSDEMNLYAEFTQFKQHRDPILFCYCGKELTKSHIRQKRKYCSPKCQNSCPDKIKLTEDNHFKKYNCKNSQQRPEVREKYKQTCLDRFGTPYFITTDEFKEKSKKTQNLRYGTEIPSQSEIIKNKTRDYFVEKYNVDNPQKLKEIKDKISDKNTVYNFQDLQKYSGKNIEFNLYLELLNYFGCSRQHFNKKLKQFNIQVNWPESQIENEVIEFIRSNDFKGERKNRKLLDGKEIDIYIPEVKLGIEVNGDYWHSIDCKYRIIDKNYHLAKTKLAESKGIRLIHIWEHEWKNNQEFCKKVIKSYLDGKIIRQEQNKLNRDYFSTLDFPNLFIELPKLEFSGKFPVYKTGYLYKEQK